MIRLLRASMILLAGFLLSVLLPAVEFALWDLVPGTPRRHATTTSDRTSIAECRGFVYLSACQIVQSEVGRSASVADRQPASQSGLPSWVASRSDQHAAEPLSDTFRYFEDIGLKVGWPAPVVVAWQVRAPLKIAFPTGYTPPAAPSLDVLSSVGPRQLRQLASRIEWIDFSLAGVAVNALAHSLLVLIAWIAVRSRTRGRRAVPTDGS